MSGLVFAMFMLIILIVVGALFSWMVYLADTSKQSSKLNEAKPLCGYKCPV